jgi:HD-GYP domain-containing protein (c-di-GMP phosphodiesterase class II)
MAKKLDEVIDSTLLRTPNTGPSVQESVAEHGLAAYNPEAKKRLAAQREQTCRAMDKLMQDTANGAQVSGNQLARSAASFLSNLIDDRDASMSLAQEIGPQHRLFWWTIGADQALADHSLKMALLGMAIAIEMGYDADNVRKLGITALVQDWGMIMVPKDIREADRALTEMEMLEVHKHPANSVNMLQRIIGLPEITTLVAYQIHERPDGSGYPRGRDDKSIHPFSKILRVADEYVAITTPRGKRRPLMAYAAMECLLRMAQRKKVDSAAVRGLLLVQSLFPIGSFVALSDGSVAQVMRRNAKNYTQPFVRLVANAEGMPVPADDNTPYINIETAGLAIVQAIPTPGRSEMPLDMAFVESRL